MDRPRFDALLPLAALIWLTGCAGNDVYGPAPLRGGVVPPSVAPTAGTSVANLALDMIGVPYRYGGADPNTGFDCSGLVFYTFTQTGLKIPRTSQDQFKASRKIALAQAGQGDLVFFQDQEKLSHVGIYLGEGRFVHAPASGSSVSIANLNAPYFQEHLVAVGRLIPDGS